ncbi:FkbM family methyltransferase [Gilvimarinus sp. DA14]|uniref:FkbM family methyltransferase n=1 Tax=Gilvimarinus sp. DA14 TaxID=2956798 RepID=UPI0020B8BB1F|nr:FkbM family methyltransferase [Gilvimarinus sp. DA14]UTF59554.1 FkbM family methyltransferase [Gilvimarinus sp. DA14]
MIDSTELIEVVKQLELSLPDNYNSFSIDDKSHICKLLDDLLKVKRDLDQAKALNEPKLDCLRLELLRLSAQTKLITNLEIISSAKPAASKLSTENTLYQGLDNIDRQLEHYLNYDNGYYIELGANNGLSQSNTAYFEKERGWKGVLIEPILHNFLECKKNRSESNYFCNAACVPFNYPQETVKLLYSNLMTSQESEFSTLSNVQEHAQRGKRFLQSHEEVVPYFALARTLTDILEDAKAPRDIDFLSLDVEGVELEVLKGLDFNKHTIKYMLIESEDVETLSEYLATHGYKKIDRLSYHDHLFQLDTD